jgi:hypothetical protein
VRPRHVGAAIVAVASGAGYSWWAAGAAPFTITAYAIVGVPALALGLLYGAWGGWSAHRPEIAAAYREAAGTHARHGVVPWLVLMAAGLTLEGLALALGGRSPAVPTLSDLVDHVVTHRLLRATGFFAWLALGAETLVTPARRSAGRQV